MNTFCCVREAGWKGAGIKAHPFRDTFDTLSPPTTEDGWEEGAVDGFRAG